MSVTVPFTQGDSEDFCLEFKDNGVAINLAGSTITLHVELPDNTAFTKTATITNAAGGLAKFTDMPDTLPPNLLEAEVQVVGGVFGSPKGSTWGRFYLDIDEEIAA